MWYIIDLKCPFPYTRASPQVIIEGHVKCLFPNKKAYSPQVIIEGYLNVHFPTPEIPHKINIIDIIDYLETQVVKKNYFVTNYYIIMGGP